MPAVGAVPVLAQQPAQALGLHPVRGIEVVAVFEHLEPEVGEDRGQARPGWVQGDFRAPAGRTAAAGSYRYLALGMRIHKAI